MSGKVTSISIRKGSCQTPLSSQIPVTEHETIHYQSVTLKHKIKKLMHTTEKARGRASF
jgi:hypothetical protein